MAKTLHSQCRGPGFDPWSVHLRAYGSMTYAAVLSMCAAKLDRGDPRVRQSLEYLTANWTVDENPGMGMPIR